MTFLVPSTLPPTCFEIDLIWRALLYMHTVKLFSYFACLSFFVSANSFFMCSSSVCHSWGSATGDTLNFPCFPNPETNFLAPFIDSWNFERNVFRLKISLTCNLNCKVRLYLVDNPKALVTLMLQRLLKALGSEGGVVGWGSVRSKTLLWMGNELFGQVHCAPICLPCLANSVNQTHL